mgnify:CR=1 FL=1
MNSTEAKINLISEMISFSVVDGKLHKKEYDFILSVATELKIDKQSYDHLFHEEIKPQKMQYESDRIQQFYRLALLMHIDGILHKKETISIHEIGIKMGLNPKSMDIVLNLMKQSNNCIIGPKVLFSAFESQHN